MRPQVHSGNELSPASLSAPLYRSGKSFKKNKPEEEADQAGGEPMQQKVKKEFMKLNHRKASLAEQI